MKKYFARPWMNQYWCKNETTGEILLINYKEPGKEYKYHYDGDSHIFFTKYDKFNQDNAKEITREEWLKVRNEHLSRLKKF
jgi:hypothetical protein